jgi:tetratricopeptide (TPR) repeat protein
VLHKIIDVAGRSLCDASGQAGAYAPLSQVLSADAIFIRDFTRLVHFSEVELLKAAVILHEVYYSYDLALHFLKEHDRRSSGRLAPRYSETVFQQPHLPAMYLNLLATISDTFTLARAHHEAGRLDMAEKLYRQILQAEPTHVEALHLMGVLAGQAGRYGQAAEHLQAALRLRPDQPVILCNLGGAYIGLGRVPDALACYQQALALLPEYPDAYYGLGRAWEAQRNFEQAANAYRQALQLKPDHAEARAHLSRVSEFTR